MLNAAHGQHVIGHVLDLAAAALHDDHFETIVVVKVNMRRRQHVAMGLMLHLIELVRQTGTVVIVNHGKRGDDRFVLVDRLSNQALAYQIANRFRTVLVAAACNDAVELPQQVFLNGNSGSC